MPRKPAATKPPEPEWLKDAPHKHLPILYNPDPNKDPEAFHKALAAIMETCDFSRIVFPSDIWFVESVTMKEGEVTPNSLKEQMTLQGDGKTWKTKHGFVWGEVLKWQPKYWNLSNAINTFKGHTFSVDANFSHSTFIGEVNFSNGTFIGSVTFSNSTFIGDANFSNSTFIGSATFIFIMLIGNVDFNSSTFIGDAAFLWCTFIGYADFRWNTFVGYVSFSKSTFSNDLTLGSTTFISFTYFNNITFSGFVDFSNSTFIGDANFSNSTFSGDANFSNSTFSGDANFSNSTFLQQAILRQLNDERSFNAHITEIATYESIENFNAASISALKEHKHQLELPLPSFNFAHTIFAKADFSTMRFLHEVTFDHAIIYEKGDFSNTLFPDKAIFESINSSAAHTKAKNYWENETGANGKPKQGDQTTFHHRRASIQETHDSTKNGQVKKQLAEALDKLSAIEECVKDLIIKENPSTPELIFDNATFGDSATDRIEFRHITDTKLSFKAVNWGCVPRFIGVELSDAVLRDTDWRAPILQGVKWHKQDRRIKLTNGDEPEKGTKEVQAWANAEELYRQFKQNYEDRRDYGTAGEFHFSEKQMKQEKAYHEKDWAVWLPLYLYRVLSGYGERALRPLFWLALLTVLMPFLYLCTGLRIKDKDYLHFKHKLEQITLTKTCFSKNADTLSNCEHFQANTNFLARYPEAFEHSLKTILPFHEQF